MTCIGPSLRIPEGDEYAGSQGVLNDNIVELMV
jgi:hypothetical protein